MVLGGISAAATGWQVMTLADTEAEQYLETSESSETFL